MQNPFQKHSISSLNMSGFYDKAPSTYFSSSVQNRELKMPYSLRKEYDEQQYSFTSSTPITNTVYPFSRSQVSSIHSGVSSKHVDNPFHRKYLCIPGVDNASIHHYSHGNQDLYALMDASRLDMSDSRYYYGIARGNHFFSQYKLQKLRHQREKLDQEILNRSTNNAEDHYSSHISHPASNKNNQMLRQAFDGIVHHQQRKPAHYEEHSLQKARGMFADIYTRMKQPGESPYHHEHENKDKALRIFHQVFSKVQQKAQQQQWEQTEQQKFVKAKNIFAQLYSKMQHQHLAKKHQYQLMKGKATFADLYQHIQRGSVKPDGTIQNEEALKARAIFSEVYSRMHSAAIKEINSGTKDHENIEKAKRIFTEVYSRMNHAISQNESHNYHPGQDVDYRSDYQHHNNHGDSPTYISGNHRYGGSGLDNGLKLTGKSFINEEQRGPRINIHDENTHSRNYEDGYRDHYSHQDRRSAQFGDYRYNQPHMSPGHHPLIHQQSVQPYRENQIDQRKFSSQNYKHNPMLGVVDMLRQKQMEKKTNPMQAAADLLQSKQAEKKANLLQASIGLLKLKQPKSDPMQVAADMLRMKQSKPNPLHAVADMLRTREMDSMGGNTLPINSQRDQYPQKIIYQRKDYYLVR